MPDRPAEYEGAVSERMRHQTHEYEGWIGTPPKGRKAICQVCDLPPEDAVHGSDCPGDGCPGCPDCADPELAFTSNFLRRSKKWRPWLWSVWAIKRWPSGVVRQHRQGSGSAFSYRTANAAHNRWCAAVRRDWQFVYGPLHSGSNGSPC